jgi:hypothetical protein
MVSWEELFAEIAKVDDQLKDILKKIALNWRRSTSLRWARTSAAWCIFPECPPKRTGPGLRISPGSVRVTEALFRPIASVISFDLRIS